MKMKTTVLALTLAVALAGMAFAHSGVTNFLPTIPDPSAMSIDGAETDWGWYDREFAVTPDMMNDPVGAVTVGSEDWTGSWFCAWSPPPDNQVYLFSRVVDDTLRASESEVKRNWWNDDMLEFNMDMDHSGGPMSWTDTEQVYNGYRIAVHPLFNGQLGATIAIDYQEPGLEDWGAMPPYCYSATTLLPSDATHMSAEVEYTYEFRATTFDRYDPILGPEGSVPHTFGPDQTWGLAVLFMEGDAEANGQQGIMVQLGMKNTAADGDDLSDAVCLLTITQEELDENYGTAVEHTTWGRIKTYTADVLAD